MHEIPCSNNTITYYWKMDIYSAPTIIIMNGVPFILHPIFWRTGAYCYHKQQCHIKQYV